MAVPADSVWVLLTEPQYWPDWGPSVRSAELRAPKMQLGATGSVKTIVGLELDFEITAYEEGSRWAWKVAGMDATDHRVESLGPDRCRVGFGVGWPAAPYLAVCQVALRKLENMATKSKVNS